MISTGKKNRTIIMRCRVIITVSDIIEIIFAEGYAV